MMMPVERLSPEQIALTTAYLTAIRDRHGTPVVRVQSLFGRSCLSMLGSDGSWDALGREAATMAEDFLRQGGGAELNLDPLPLIEIHLMMQEQKRDVVQLRQLLDRIAPELEAQPQEVRSIGRVRNIAVRLSRMGLPIRAAPIPKDAAALLHDDESWVIAPAALLSDLADHLVADDVPLDKTNSRILSLVGLGELRNYRLDLGCKLLRTVLQLGVVCEETRHGLDFIALQRRRDGRYGFLDRLSEKTEQMADPDLSLFLPLTLNAVWLFAIEAARRTASLSDGQPRPA